MDNPWKDPTNPRYVKVPYDMFVTFLESKGFTEVDIAPQELVYGRKHHKYPWIWVLVYTSIAKGTTVVRKCNVDAIKVATVARGNGWSRGVGKFPHVLRTGNHPQEVLDRVLDRMRQAYLRAAEYGDTNTVKKVMNG